MKVWADEKFIVSEPAQQVRVCTPQIGFAIGSYGCRFGARAAHRSTLSNGPIHESEKNFSFL
jgi:hypothetical protein